MGKKHSSAALPVGREPATATDGFDQAIPSSFIEQYIKRPGSFIVPSAAARTAAMEVVGSTYDAANYSDKFGLYDDWRTVLASGFDPSLQIWELINIRNEPVLKYTTDIMKELSQLIDSVNDESDSDVSDASEQEEELASNSAESEEDEEALSIGEASEEAGETAAHSDLDSEVEEASDLGSSNGMSVDGSDDGEDDKEEYEDDKNEPSVVDDQFFSLADMEKFADDGDEEDMRDRAILAGDYSGVPADQDGEESADSDEDDDDDDIDMFQDLNAGDDDDDASDEDDEGGPRVDEMMYTDFFKAPKGSKRGLARASLEKHAKRVKFDPNTAGDSDVSEPESEDNSESVQTIRKRNLFDADGNEDNEASGGVVDTRSDFEKRQEKLQGLITKFEDEAVDKKHWTMTGEVTSAARPKDSLLEEDLEFDHVQKPVPIVTQEATQTLEDVIKRRILNEEWDDVERKKDVQAKPFRPSEFIELNDKAPKKSLAEEYESEYLAQKAGDAYVPEDDAKLAVTHREIDVQFRNLFAQLDALSHFHFAPKPATADIEVRTNAPALRMEEKLPVHVSQAEQLAPEEIYEKDKGRNGRTGDLMGDSELTREDRKRRRQRKKEMNKKKSSAVAAQKPASKKESSDSAAVKAAKGTKVKSAA
ncbi:U3 snoRNP protein [Coemansia thaxteri]|nr:U3 snoRNP protein [Coemansia thaxteri]KAJ2472023.1 U3 snoRNP protein [Coemansia sp. RSA 2322]